MDRFRRHVEVVAGAQVEDSKALHRWSVEDPGRFWSTLWTYLELPGSQGATSVQFGDRFEDTTFFPEGTIDVAERAAR